MGKRGDQLNSIMNVHCACTMVSFSENTKFNYLLSEKILNLQFKNFKANVQQQQARLSHSIVEHFERPIKKTWHSILKNIKLQPTVKWNDLYLTVSDTIVLCKFFVILQFVILSVLLFLTFIFFEKRFFFFEIIIAPLHLFVEFFLNCLYRMF